MWAERRVCDIFDSTLFPECSDRHRKYHSGAALPGEAIPLQQPANAYAAKGMYREALAEYEKYAAFIPGNPLALAYVGYAHARLVSEIGRSAGSSSSGRLRRKGTCLPFPTPSFMSDWARRSRPSRGWRRLAKSAPIFSPTSKCTRSGIPCAQTPVSKICFDVSAYRNSTGRDCFGNREAASQPAFWDAGGIHMAL